MNVYIVYDLDNRMQHELFEVWSTSEGAQARCVELNKLSGYVVGDIEFDEDGESGWQWREVELQK